MSRRRLLAWIAGELGPDTYVNLIDQYYPAGRVNAGSYPEINRRPAPAEIAEAREVARELRLTRVDRRRPHPRLLRRRVG